MLDYHKGHDEHWQSLPGTGGEIKPASEFLHKRAERAIQEGEKIVAVKEEEAKTLFPDGWNAVKPYLRIVKQPKTLN
mgnify:CR=1 FL=1